MILQALTRYYEDLLSRGEIAAPGWSPAKISYALCLNGAGDLEHPSVVEGHLGDLVVVVYIPVQHRVLYILKGVTVVIFFQQICF